MTDRRTFSSRFQLGLIIILVVLLALASFWLLDVMRRSGEDDGGLNKRTEPDYYVEQFSFVRMNKEGKIQYHVSGEKMVHHPQSDTYEITQPTLRSVNDKLPTTTIVAKRAVADLNLSQVELFNNVQMQRPASRTAKRLEVTSEYMVVLPDEDIVKTDRPVKIISGNAVLSGVGMVANQATREFKLFGNVQGMLPPQTAR